MRQKVDWGHMTKDQRVAMKQINALYNKMLECFTEDELFDVFCEADDLWEENFPFEAAQWGDGSFLHRRFNDMNRELRRRKAANGGIMTFNVMGHTVSVQM